MLPTSASGPPNSDETPNFPADFPENAASFPTPKTSSRHENAAPFSDPATRPALAPFEFQPLRIAPPADAQSLKPRAETSAISNSQLNASAMQNAPSSSTRFASAPNSYDVNAQNANSAPEIAASDFAPIAPQNSRTRNDSSSAQTASENSRTPQNSASLPSQVSVSNENVARSPRLSSLNTLLLGGLLACALVGLGALLGGRGDVSSTRNGANADGVNADGMTVDLANQNAIISAVQQVGPAVMNVDTTFGGNGDKNFLPQPGTSSRPVQGKGTGFVFDSARGLMLTNAHVVADAQKIQVTTRDGKKYTGRILGVDRRSDIAVVSLSSKTLPAAKLAPMKNAKDLQIGQWAIAIGNPFAQANTVTVGVVSAVGRTIPETNEKTGEVFQLTDMIQTDAAINPGNSGGPLCNIRGEVIGINTAIYGIGTGLGFTIPINKAKAVADEIIKHGSVQRAFIGLNLQPITSATQQEFGLKDAKGALIQGTAPDSPAARAGFQAGDIVRRINGQPMSNKAQIDSVLSKLKIGANVKIEISRNGANRVLEIKTVEQKGA